MALRGRGSEAGVKQSKVWFLLLAISLLAMFFASSGLHVLSREAVYPFSNFFVWTERVAGKRVRALLQRADYAARYARLEQDLARLQVLVDEADAKDKEIARLRQALELVSASQSRLTVAPIVSRGGTLAVWQSVRLGKGSDEGLRKGDVVIVPEGVVGRITAVTPHTSDVMLITDPNSRVACELELPVDEQIGAVRGILYGGGVRAAADATLTLLYVVEPLRLRYLAREYEPAPRTRVITSGLGTAYPKGLTVGYLLSSKAEANNLSREGEVVPAVDIAALDYVFVYSVRRSDAR